MDKREMNKDRLVTADMLQNLPEPVQRYLTYSGVIGQPWIDTVRLKYGGRFRLAADKPWMPMAAEQCYTTNPPGFHWKARFKLAGLPLMRGSDTYKAGHGHMFGKLAGLFTIFDERGEKLDQGTMMRYLNEMTWFPSAYLSDYVTWQAVDAHCADVTFTDGGKSVSARMYFDDAGHLLNFVTQRYRGGNGQYSLDTWCTPMTAFGPRAGLNIPVRGMGVWNLPSGDLPYIDIELAAIAYNQPIQAF
jgi:hypothetical protein